MGQAPTPPSPPISPTPIDISTKAVVNNPDGSLFYRQEHEFTNCDENMQKMIYDMLQKQTAYLEAEAEKDKKEPDQIFSAILSATGMPDLVHEAFTFKLMEKARNNWNKLGDEVMRYGEKRVKGKP